MTGMRILTSAPDAVIDPSSGAPRFGSYSGAVRSVDLASMARGRLHRIAREKRWMYVAIASENTFVAMAIVRLGYAATCFAYALDARAMRMIATRSVVAPATSARVSDRTSDGSIARFDFGSTHARIERPRDNSAYDIAAHFSDFELRARIDTARAPPAITAIAPIGTDRARLANVTEKRALLAATGDLVVAGQRYPLDGALAGYDYTHGLLARRTIWRWAFALGHAKTGERVGFNLVQGFVGEPECAAWVDGELFPLTEGRFAFDRDRPLAEWRVSTADGAVDLKFAPAGMHSEDKNLGLIASKFVQPCGLYSGTLRVGGKELVLERVLGVTEDQDVLW